MNYLEEGVIDNWRREIREKLIFVLVKVVFIQYCYKKMWPSSTSAPPPPPVLLLLH